MMRVVSCQRENWKIDTEQANELGFFCFSCRNPRGPGLLLKVDRFSTTEAPLFGLPLTSSTLSAGNVKRHDDPDNLPSGRRSSRPCPGRCKLPDTRRRVMHGGSKRYALGSKTQKVLLTCLCPEGQGKLSLSPKHSCSEPDSVSSRYQDYLSSDHWFELKSEKLNQVSRCIVCDSVAWLVVHHINYKRLYDCELSDLTVLCDGCHTGLHRALKASGLKSFDVPESEIPEFLQAYNDSRQELTAKAGVLLAIDFILEVHQSRATLK